MRCCYGLVVAGGTIGVLLLLVTVLLKTQQQMPVSAIAKLIKLGRFSSEKIDKMAL
jgi:hypothetical protein